MNICIFGGGPTGLRIADRLSSKGYNVELHEKETKLGGCWKVDWQDGYYREHSPRVMTTGYTKTLELFSKLGEKTKSVYGSSVQIFTMFMRYFYRYMTTSDIMKLLNGMYFTKRDDKRTLKEWMDDNKISDEGRKAISKVGISLATNSRELLAYPFFITIKQGQGAKFIQSAGNDRWISLWEKDVIQRPNVKIMKDSKLLSLEYKDERLIAKTNTEEISNKTIVCAMPLYGLKEVLENSSSNIKNNWMDFKDFEKFTYESSYSGIGFQLHFTTKMPSPVTWYGGFTDWEMEVLSISSYSDTASKNHFIKDVWSCVIIDTNAKSKHLKKKVNQIDDFNTVIEEAIRQLSLAYGISIHPYKVTLAKGVFYNKEKKYWDMGHSAYNPSFKEELPSKGNIDNLYSVGPHNFYEISVLEAAFKSADRFTNEYIKNNKIQK